MAELHRDCVPFKKGQINIATLSHENTAVMLLFKNPLSHFEYFEVHTYSITYLKIMIYRKDEGFRAGNI